MWNLDQKESFALKNWCLPTVVLDKTFESPLNSKDIKSINPKGNYPWIFIGRIDTKAETPVFWQSDAKNQLIGKDPDAWKDWRQKEKGMTENEMVGWHHWFNEHEFEWTLGDSEGQGSLACCSPWDGKELDMTEQLNNNHRWGYYITKIPQACGITKIQARAYDASLGDLKVQKETLEEAEGFP